MNIGNHQITGKRIPLKNHILVCEKINDKGVRSLRVSKIIKEKILFNSRPTPILTAQPNNIK